MTRTTTKRVRRDQKPIKALGHDLRVEILAPLNERVASPVELHRELQEELSQVSYHVKRCAIATASNSVDTRPVRGSVEHFYRATERARCPRRILPPCPMPSASESRDLGSPSAFAVVPRLPCRGHPRSAQRPPPQREPARGRRGGELGRSRRGVAPTTATACWRSAIGATERLSETEESGIPRHGHDHISRPRTAGRWRRAAPARSGKAEAPGGARSRLRLAPLGEIA